MAPLSVSLIVVNGQTKAALRLCLFCAVSLVAAVGLAQDVAARKVRISFLPPPLEGRISLGIYGEGGKLVRVLHREADLDEFDAGDDALNTMWDGKDDAGEPLPPGKYRARGCVVGDLEVEGIGFFFNDWVTGENSPHISRIVDIWPRMGGGFGIDAEGPTGRVSLPYDDSGKPAAAASRAPGVRFIGGKLRIESEEAATEFTAAAVTDLKAATRGRGDTVWIIDGREVKQFAFSGEFLRRLEIPADAPAPIAIAASQTSDTIFLLEQAAGLQQVRALTLAKPADDAGVSDWAILFEKKIVAHDAFTIAEGKPVTSGGQASLEKLAVALVANPLQHDTASRVELAVGSDAQGSFLRTIDGLPLQTISEARHLKRIALSPHGKKAVDVFQDDGAVVEQFRVSGLDQMMAFDCGEIELK